MRTTVLTLVGVTLAAALVILILPDDARGAGIRRAVRLFAALAVPCILLSSLRFGFTGGRFALFDEITAKTATARADYEAEYRAMLNAAGAAQIEEKLPSLLAGKFGGAAEDYAVRVTVTEETPARVSVRLRGAALLVDPDEAETYLADMLGCEAEVR